MDANMAIEYMYAQLNSCVRFSTPYPKIPAKELAVLKIHFNHVWLLLSTTEVDGTSLQDFYA